MAKFCTYCGKPLPENGQCDCPESAAARAQQAQQAAPQPGAAPQAQAQPLSENEYVQKTKAAANALVPFLKAYWKDPMGSTVAAMREKNLGVPVLLMVINALLAGLVLFVSFARLLSPLSSLMDLSVPFFPPFLLGIVMAAIGLALAAVLLFLLLKVLKINASFTYVVIAVGANSLPYTACLVLALLLALFAWATGIVIALVLAGVVSCVLAVALLTKVFGVQITGAAATLIAVFCAAALLLNCWLGSKLALSAAGSIEVSGDSISDLIDEMEDFDISDILGGMMGSSYYW